MGLVSLSNSLPQRGQERCSDEVVIGVPEAPVGGANAAGIIHVTRAFDRAFLFGDGFEDDGTASWSAVVP